MNQHATFNRFRVQFPAVIYGQDALYAARGQEARSRDGQDALYAARGRAAWMHAYRDTGMQAVDRVGNRRSRTPAAARRKPESKLSVIPAKAGIQWFIQAIPAQRECRSQ